MSKMVMAVYHSIEDQKNVGYTATTNILLFTSVYFSSS